MKNFKNLEDISKSSEYQKTDIWNLRGKFESSLDNLSRPLDILN